MANFLKLLTIAFLALAAANEEAAAAAGAVKDAVTEAVTDAAADGEKEAEPETAAGEETATTEQEAEENAQEEATAGAADNVDPPVATTLSAATVVGAESIEVASAKGFAIGGKITIKTPAGVVPAVSEEAEIRGFGSLVLANPLTNVFPPGSSVTQQELDRTYPPNGGGGCPSIKDRTECCKHKDDRTTNPTNVKDMDCVPAAPQKTFATGNVCEPACVIADTCDESYPTEAADLIGTCEAPTTPPPPTPAPAAVTPTTTITPWDSSASSSGDSDSLDSSYSSSFKEDSSGETSTDSSVESSGSDASGSSGSYMPLWMWLAGLCLLCVCAIIPALMAPKKKKAPKKKPAPAPKPVDPVPDLQPIATTSAVIPSYQMAMPVTTSYQPAPVMQYAAPATTAYAAPAAYAAPMSMPYAAPVTYSGGYGGGYGGAVV